MLIARTHWMLGLFGGTISIAALVACSGDVPKPSSDDGNGNAGSTPVTSLYADDAGAPVPVPTATPTTVPPATPIDGGFDASDGALDPATVCKELAFCCAQPKVCAEETIACDDVVQTNDPNQCSLTLASYKQIGCAHDDTAPVPYLPTFQGCSGGASGSFWSWFGF